MTTFYDDGEARLASEGPTIHRSFRCGAPTRIAHRDFDPVRRLGLRAFSGKWRIWGSGDL